MALNYAKLQQKRTSSGGMGWKPKEGENRIRVLPPTTEYFDAPENLEDFAVSYKMHFFKIEGRPTEVSRCLRETGGRCPACDAWRANRESADPGLQKKAKDVSPSDMYLFNILDINNLSQGIQVYQANWTCWDKIMEIGANPDWGDVISPIEGINFVINKTAGSKSRSGYPAYSVMPEPQRTSVVETLAGIEGWKDKLDELENNITPAKTPEEIRGFLAEMGFPGFTAQNPPPASSAPSPGVAPPAASSPPPPSPGTPPPTQVVVPEAPPQEAPPSATSPSDVPACFGDYKPQVHPCATCPVQSDCQMKYLGLG
jgi:hypothetical protein